MAETRCGHCGREGFLEQVEELELRAHHVQPQTADVQDEVEPQVWLVVMRCTRCEEVTLVRYTLTNGSSGGGRVCDSERIFPEPRPVEDLPERVRTRYAKMLELAYEPDAFAMRAGKYWRPSATSRDLQQATSDAGSTD